VWIHDSYFERDSVTYASAIASQVPDIRVAMGALNPFTRHPVLVAMTVSAVDEMAPGRVILGLGSALPLRLAQMGIPYDPGAAVAVAGSLFSLIAEPRRAALNRARREPFVIYMMAIQTDVAIRRAGLELELRDRVFGLWRNEDYHEAAQLIPDEMMDAFLL